MAKKNRQEIKDLFRNGLKPDEGAFADIIDSSINFTDDSIIAKNGKVGIKTTNPAAVLHVYDGISDDVLKGKTSTTFMLGKDGGNNLSMNGVGIQARNSKLASILHVQPTGGDVRFFSATKEVNAIVIKDSGRIGVGTDDPQALLHIVPLSKGKRDTPRDDFDEKEAELDERMKGMDEDSLAEEERRKKLEELMLIKEDGSKRDELPDPILSPALILGAMDGLNLRLGLNSISTRFGLKATTLRLNPNGGNISHLGSIIHDSDKKLKQNIKPLNKGLKEVLKLNPVSYNWKKETGNEQDLKFGFLAQDVEKIITDIAYTNPETGIKGISSIELIPVLVKSIQEQNKTILDLEARMSKLEKLVQKK